MATETKERKRRPAARHHDVVLAAMEERLLMMSPDDVHAKRVLELVDELRRSLKKGGGDEDE